MIVVIKGTGKQIYRNTVGACLKKFADRLEKHVPAVDGQGKVLPFTPRVVDFVFEKTVEEQRAYLSYSDWYVVRLQETGEAIPDDVSRARQVARDFLSS